MAHVQYSCRSVLGGNYITVKIRSFPVVRSVDDIAVKFGEVVASPRTIRYSNTKYTQLILQTPAVIAAEAVNVTLLPNGDAEYIAFFTFTFEAAPQPEVTWKNVKKASVAGSTKARLRLAYFPVVSQVDEVTLVVGEEEGECTKVHMMTALL